VSCSVADAAVSGSSVRDDNRLQTTAATSSPISTANRFASLASTDGDRTACQFVEHVSRRSKRLRQQSTEERLAQQQQQSCGSQNRCSFRLLTGTAAASSKLGLTSAKKFVKKAVFCVDNANIKYDVDNLRSFVSSLSVNVLSCFPTNPRRRRGEEVSLQIVRLFACVLTMMIVDDC